MLTEIKPSKVFLVTGYTDLRLGIDGLASIIHNEFQMNLYDNTLFLFCGKRPDRIKGILWDSNGFILLYKRLENGTYRWPRNSQEARQLNAEQIKRLSEGFEIDPRNKPINTRNLSII